MADRAITSLGYAPTTLANWYGAVMGNYPQGHRYVADNMFTSASAEELLPRQDPADDERYCEWTGASMAAMSHLATGISLADENLARRPAKFISDSNMPRLAAVRSSHDPDARFHCWLSRP